MITLRRNASRRHLRCREYDIWATFHPKARPDQPDDEFGALVGLDEMRLPPGEFASRRPRAEIETVTYVYRGSLVQGDSTGRSGVVHAGEVQRMTTNRGVSCTERNASRSDPAHVFRISLRRMEAGPGAAVEQKRFAAARRHNLLCLVASPDGRTGSLRVDQDALVYSSVLDPGYHIIYELEPKRSAWLHIVGGEVKLLDLVLKQGDGVGVIQQPSVSFTAQESTEVLLVDLGGRARAFAGAAFTTTCHPLSSPGTSRANGFTR